MALGVTAEAAPFAISIGTVLLGIAGNSWAKRGFLEKAREWLHAPAPGDDEAQTIREMRLVRYADYWADVPQFGSYLGPPFFGLFFVKDHNATAGWMYMVAVAAMCAVFLRSALLGVDRYKSPGRLLPTPIQAVALLVNTVGVAMCAVTASAPPGP
jgi:hypothetical protein